MLTITPGTTEERIDELISCHKASAFSSLQFMELWL